ncbi:hypothetical protein EG069_19555 [Salmonella enterica]|nr:hypothetical protein [Salmonella enterica]EBR0085666.1 hypothetical protein [Salmonella enterica subsp. enterica serovar Wangata]EDT2941866.1 hypothetical protein [Salmonella enterica subsp. enterica]
MKKYKSNQVAQSNETKATEVEWLTIKDMPGLPGMPTTTQGCQKLIKKQLEMKGDDTLKRKLPGGKAFIYHYSLLPWEALDYWAERHNIKNIQLDAQQYEAATRRQEQLPGQIPKATKELVKKLSHNSDIERLRDQLFNILDLMTQQELKKAIEIFKIKGLSGLMPEVIGQATGTAASKEILQQRIQPGRSQAAGHDVGPQNDGKKAG